MSTFSTVIKNRPLILVVKPSHSTIPVVDNRISNKISVSSKLRLIFIYFRFLSNFSIKFLFNFLTCTTLSVKQNQFSYFNISSFQNGQNPSSTSGWRQNQEIQHDKSPDIIKDTKGEWRNNEIFLLYYLTTESCVNSVFIIL